MTPQAVAPPQTFTRKALVVALGVVLGFSLSRIGFTDYGELARMFTFADLRMFGVFAGGVVVTAIGLRVVLRLQRRTLEPRPIETRVIVGGVIFGLGWAIAGACPGVAFAQLGEGKLWALLSIAGMFAGTAIVQRARRQRLQAPTC